MSPRPLLGLLALCALTTTGCGATPTELACRDAELIRVGMTQHQVSTLTGRPYRFEERAEGTRWRIYYRKPRWAKNTFDYLFISIVGWPALPFLQIFLLRHYHKAYVQVLFDGKGRVKKRAAAVNRGGYPLDCHEVKPEPQPQAEAR